MLNNKLRLIITFLLVALFSGCGSNSTTTSAPKTFAYVADYNGNIYRCNVNGNTGALFSCVVSNPSSGVDTTSWSPYNIVFNNSSGTFYAYISDYKSGIYQCGVNTINGALTTCTSTPFGTPLWTNPTGIAFNNTNGTLYSYVSDFAGAEYQCGVSYGFLTSCIATPASGAPAWNPYTSLTFYALSSGTYAYLTDYTQIYVCNVAESGALDTCSVTAISGNPESNPNGVTVYNTNGINYGYISTESGNLYKCDVESSNGSLNSCYVNESPSAGWIPYGVTFNVINGKTYAYVPDQLDYTGSGDYLGNIYQCQVGESGSLTKCILTPETGAPSNWLPDSLVFVTM